MQTPINDIDYVRFLQIAKLIKDLGSPASSIQIYVDSNGSYASIEMRGHYLPADKLREFFQYQPSFEEMEKIKSFLEGMK